MTLKQSLHKKTCFEEKDFRNILVQKILEYLNIYSETHDGLKVRSNRSNDCTATCSFATDALGS